MFLLFGSFAHRVSVGCTPRLEKGVKGAFALGTVFQRCRLNNIRAFHSPSSAFNIVMAAWRVSQNRGVTEPGRPDALRGKPCIAFGIVADLSAMRAAIDLKHHVGGGHKKVPQDEGLRRVERLLNAYGGRRQDLAQQGIERSLSGPDGQVAFIDLRFPLLPCPALQLPTGDFAVLLGRVAAGFQVGFAGNRPAPLELLYPFFGVRRRDLVLERASAMQMLITDSKMGRAIRSSMLNIGAAYSRLISAHRAVNLQ